MSWANGFDVAHYLGRGRERPFRVRAMWPGMSEKEVSRHIILGLKDMAGVCPPRFMTEVVTALRKRWPSWCCTTTAI